MYLGSLMGDVPFRNWRTGTWNDDAMQALDGTAMEETILTGTGTCHSCTVACKREVAVPEEPYRVNRGPGPEYETVASFGSMTLVSDLKAIATANDRCNRYGLDTISCGSTIAFAIEATERGLLESNLTWGNATEVLETVDAIACRRGLGDLLAEGSARAAALLGPGAAELAITVKGLELPMHSPRAYHGLGLSYATAPRGACHNAANVYLEMGGVLYPELGLEAAWKEQSSMGKALVSAVGQDCVRPERSVLRVNNLNFTVTELQHSTVTGFIHLWTRSRTGERLWHLASTSC
jgi:aldehyde:ferredoxin oxidoreductase